MKDSVLTLSVGQALEVQDALRRQGLPLSFLKEVTSGNWFSQLNEVMAGRAEIIRLLIPAPTIPDTFRVDYSLMGTYPDCIEGRKHTEFDRADTVEYCLDQVKLWLLHTQENGGVIGGKALYEYIKNSGILSTCLALRDLEEIQKLGIEVFRKYFGGQAIFAWKDVVQFRSGNRQVPCLFAFEGEVVMDWRSLDDDWNDSDPAARFVVLAP